MTSFIGRLALIDNVTPVLVGLVVAIALYLLIKYINDNVDFHQGGRSWRWVTFFSFLGVALTAAAILFPYTIMQRLLVLTAGLMNVYAAIGTAFQLPGFRPVQFDPLDGYDLEGQLREWPSKEALAAGLETAGLQASVYPYSISVDDCDNFYFVYENTNGSLDSPVVDATAYTMDDMRRDARLVSAALDSMGLRYRFELFDGEDLVETMEHDWDGPIA